MSKKRTYDEVNSSENPSKHLKLEKNESEQKTHNKDEYEEPDEDEEKQLQKIQSKLNKKILIRLSKVYLLDFCLILI